MARARLARSHVSNVSAAAKAIASLFLDVHPDSGCTGSVTSDPSVLINRRPCDDAFSSADKTVARSTCIGDLPVLVSDATGVRRLLIFENVRCVPSFGYTLLGVKQMWREQKIRSRFDDKLALELSNGVDIPYIIDRELPSIRAVSVTRLLAAAPKSLSALPAVSTPRLTTPAAAPARPDTPQASRADVDSPPLMPTPRSPPLPPPPKPRAPTPAPPSEPAQSKDPEAIAVSTIASSGVSSRPLGFHKVGATSHIARLPASQAAELIHRRCHFGAGKLRALPFTTSDAPKVLSSAPSQQPCVSCAQASITRASHSGTLSAPAPEPGYLHFDIKEMVTSLGGYRYIVFLIDEHSRYVFYDYIKLKSDAAAAVLRGLAAFNATVGTPTDEHGRPLPRPRVRAIHSDREGKLVSAVWQELRAHKLLHHTLSPPHDHDLNPIAEAIIRVIATAAVAIRLHANASPRLWPWIIAYAVDWHNAGITAVGSSTADANLSPTQRFTLRPPRVMDLPAFGCRAVILKPPALQHKPSLSGRGLVGGFLGRSRNSKGCYDVLVSGDKVVRSSSVLVDEEFYVWAPASERHRPLLAVSSRAAALAPPEALQTGAPTTTSDVSAPTTYTSSEKLIFLNLFSGPYARVDGLSARVRAAGWDRVIDVDNDGEKGGGWGHDLLNDETYATALRDALAGAYSGIMVAFPCSTFAITRFFDATDGDGGDRGPPPIRTLAHPDGLPDDQIDPKHARELKLSNLLLERTVNICIAARQSPARSTIVLENPADRSPGASIASSPEFADHGALPQTSAFKRLDSAVGLSTATFAYCRLGSDYQKYTSLYYTADAAPVLDELNLPQFKCNHPRGSHAKQAGGRGSDGKFVSSAAAAYPSELCSILTRAFSVARTGDAELPPRAPPGAIERKTTDAKPPASSRSTAEADGEAPPSTTEPAPPSVNRQLDHGRQALPASPSPPSSTAISGASPTGSLASTPKRGGAPPSPVTFPSLPSGRRTGLGPQGLDGEAWRGSTSTGADSRARRATDQRKAGFSYFPQRKSHDPAPPQSPLSSIIEEPAASPGGSVLHSPSGTSLDGYSPFSEAANVMEAAVAESVFDAESSAALLGSSETDLVPITTWVNTLAPPSTRKGKRLPGGSRTHEVFVALSEDEKIDSSFIATIAHALRADSPDAPSSHAEAAKLGDVWMKAEGKEIGHHRHNETWDTITRDELPPGRRVHKLIWVYKVKRDGTCKARLCVQGTTLEAGIDYDQVFSAALRYSSARALFAFAARNGCKVRGVDLVAAYLQGRFVEGEVVYCHLPVGYPQFDSSGRPKLARVKKPIYGIQQAGRRLQRMLFEWVKGRGFKSLDDSDQCVFVKECANDEVLAIGIYVDNIQIVHSVEVDGDGRGPDGCEYNALMDALKSDWDVTDEGPMEDLLGIEVEYNDDGSIKLHQRKYIEKIVKRFLPDGPSPSAQRNGLPYSGDFLLRINAALSQTSVEYPHLVTEMQQRVGCLMYAATSTRPDIAFAVHQLCKCMQRPTPDLLKETDHLLSYLSRNASLGLTYTREHARLAGFSDASWEVASSTSGWFVLWQNAALLWGSRKQKCTALSTCESEMIALSEAAKDVVYARKLVKGLRAEEPGPTQLATDSQSARDVSYNPQHHDKMKHVQRRHFFVRDMVESFELEVPFVPTKENAADILTKPMKNASHFRALRRMIMNERD